MDQGTLNAATVRVGEMLRPALAANAHALALAHNHPSGDPTPSLEERRLMRQIGDASALHDCEPLDVLILGQGRWVSMYEQSGKSKRWRDEQPASHGTQDAPALLPWTLWKSSFFGAGRAM